MGQRRSKRRAVRFQGIPGGVARGSIPGRVATSYSIPVGSKRQWWFEVLRLYQGSVVDCIYQVKSRFVYTRSLPDSVYTRSLPDSVYTRSLPRFCLYQVVFFYSHQFPWGGERLGGQYTPVERLRRRLRDGLREACLLGDGAHWGRLVSLISTMVGGWVWRPKAAASGRAASIATLVSGRWARGNSGYTIPGLSLIASPASRVGQVIWGLAGRPEKGLVQGCSREGEEKPDPELFTLEGVVFKSCLGSGKAGL